MKVSIWGCVQKYPKEDNTIRFPGRLGVESYQALRSIDPIRGERILLLSVRYIEREDSPIWLRFESLEEAQELVEHLNKAIEAYKKDEDYGGGSTPRSFVVT